MKPMEDFECELPTPICMRICCKHEDFYCAVRGGFKEILKEHNSTHTEQIEILLRRIMEPGLSGQGMEYNSYEICVGDEVVMTGQGPKEDEARDKQIAFYRSLLLIVKGVLEGWHDKIIELQKKNEAKIEILRYEGQYAILYRYYEVRHNKKALFYLKKLVELYPDSRYVNKLRRVYSVGLYGRDSFKPELVKKMKSRFDEDL